MKTEELILQSRRIGGLFDRVRTVNDSAIFSAAQAHASEFLRQYAGPESAFLATLKKAQPRFANLAATDCRAVMDSFTEYLEAGLHSSLSPERQAQLEVVSDFLEQSDRLLADSKVHPASAAVIIGATLEEFLRNWIEHEKLTITGSPGIDSYAKTLRAADLINKQDIKDIAAWAGIRNAAAHGLWDEVRDRGRIRIMLEGVNLFLQRHTPS